MSNATLTVSADTLTMGQVLELYRTSDDASVVRAAMLVLHGDPMTTSFTKPTPALFKQAMLLLVASWNFRVTAS